MAAELKHKFALIDDINIHYVSTEPDNKKTCNDTTFIFLHGFPEYWQAWQKQLDFFSNNYRVIAPDLPGYNLSDKPQNVSFYEVSNLINFMAKFIRTISPNEKVYLVAHDWGGAIAWPLAAFYSQYIEKLVILNAAHPSTFTREMINNPEQREKSEYIHDLISRQAQDLLYENNCQYLCDKMMISSNPSVFTESTLSNYRKAWLQPGAINGMLQYYRAMPQLAETNRKREQSLQPCNKVIQTTKMKIPNIRIDVPTLILWGERDQAFVNENLKGIDDYVPNCSVERFSSNSHWLMHERSNEINHAITRFINT